MLKLEVIGNLGADAEVKSSNGKQFVTFRVAHTDKWTGDDNVKHETTTWVDCILANVESKVIPYLKQGVKVMVRGNMSLRVFSSQKERAMKAGAQVNVMELELVGGATDLVPRQLIVPDTGQIVDVSKYYWCNLDTKGMKKDGVRSLFDQNNRQYLMDSKGFVSPVPLESAGKAESHQTESQSNSESK